MKRRFLRAKIHQAVVTEANLDYVGSLSIDREIMELADVAEYEEVMISNLNNGERLFTYAIGAPRGSRCFCANGAAAHKIGVGDRIIIFTFADLDENEIQGHQPRIVFMSQENEPTSAAGREEHGAMAQRCAPESFASPATSARSAGGR